MVEIENFLPILTFILFFITIGNILIFNFDIMQPAVITSCTMMLSLFLGTINIERWNLFVGSYTSIIFLLGLIAFFSGCLFSQYTYFINRKNKPNVRVIHYSASYVVIFAMALIVLILAYLSGREMYNMSLALGNNDGLTNMIKIIRYPFEKGEISFSRWMRYRNLIAMSIATVFLYIYCYKTTFIGESIRENILYLLPTLCAIPFFFLSTGRRSFIQFIITACVLMTIFFQQKKGYSSKIRLKILKLLGVAFSCSLVIYFLMGFLTGKVQVGGRGPLTIISHYGGLSVPALDIFLNNSQIENQYIGQNSLVSLYGNLNTLGMHLELGRNFLPFVQFQGIDYIDTNVYTVLYRMIADWSILGMIMTMFICGSLITLCYDYLKYNSNPLLLVLYAYFGYIPFFLFIDDQFMTIFTTENIYFSIMCAILLHFLKNTSTDTTQ